MGAAGMHPGRWKGACMMRTGQVLQRMEQIYHQLEEECFMYIGTIIQEEANVDQRLLDELLELLGFLAGTDVYDQQLLSEMRELLDCSHPIYQLSTCKMLTLEGLEEKMDVLDDEKQAVEETLAKVYYEQRHQLLEQSRSHLKQLQRQMQALLYAEYPTH
jgi:hypothetical protein